MPILEPDERIIRTVDTHWMKYALPTIVFVLLLGISALLFYLAALSAHHTMWISHGTFLAGIMLATMNHHWFFHHLLSDHFTDIIVTSKRIIYLRESLYFQNDMQEIPLRRIKSVTGEKHGILQTILNYGTLRFDIDIGITIPFAPHPHHLVKDINEALAMK